jgi:hypothetical protein
MRHSRWIILSVIFLQTLCYGTSIVLVVSATGEYVVIATESRNTAVGTRSSDNRACKVIALDNTLFFNAGNVIIGTYRGKPWDSLETARELYKASKNRDAQRLSIAWGNRALAWFYGQSSSDLQSTALPPDGALVTGGFVDFDFNKNPESFSQNLYFDVGTRQLSRKPASQSKGQIGISGIHTELVIEFEKAETPRALKAYGTLKIHNVTNDLSYDIEFVKRAVQFVIDNVPDNEKDYVHGPIDVVVLRRLGGIEWVSRKPNCYHQDVHLPKK